MKHYYFNNAEITYLFKLHSRKTTPSATTPCLPGHLTVIDQTKSCSQSRDLGHGPQSANQFTRDLWYIITAQG